MVRLLVRLDPADAQGTETVPLPGCMEFDEHDVEIFRRYLTFCGIGIQNAQLFEMSVQEYRRNQILLNLARSIFEEQNNLECLVTKIMTEARELLKCERCSVFLVDLDCCEAVRGETVGQVLCLDWMAIDSGHEINLPACFTQLKSRPCRLFAIGGEWAWRTPMFASMWRMN